MFLDRLRPTITIDADSGELIFRRGDTEVRQQPLIRVAADGRIINFVPADAGGAESRLIRLFASDASDHDDALRAFCRYHTMLVSRRSFGFRPRVIILEPAVRREFGRDAAKQIERAFVRDGFMVDVAT